MKRVFLSLTFLYFTLVLFFDCHSVLFGQKAIQSDLDIGEFIYNPEAYVVDFSQPVVASGDILARDSFLKQKQRTMLIWVRITFDKKADDIFVNDYFRFIKKSNVLKSINPIRHKKFTDQFVFKVNCDVRKEEIEKILSQANENFNASIKKLEQLAIEKKNEEIKRKEQERKEREYKEEKERRKRELEEAILKEQRDEELKKQAKERVEAEKALKIERERVAAIEQEKKAKEAKERAEQEERLRIQKEQSMISQGVEMSKYNYLMCECNRIAERFTSMGEGGQSSSKFGAIFSFLQDEGDITAYWVLKKQIEMGRVPASYLNNI